jgi:hypothetical protein
MTLHDVAAEPPIRRERPFQVDAISHLLGAEGGAHQRLAHHVGRERRARALSDRQADT